MALRYLAKKAVALKEQGLDMERIKEELHKSIESSVSFVIPEDFEFLKRNGRLTPIAAKTGGTMKLLPVLTQTKEKTRIAPVGIKRSWKAAVEMILQQVKERFPLREIELLELSPAPITHGDPGCIVIQAIGK